MVNFLEEDTQNRTNLKPEEPLAADALFSGFESELNRGEQEISAITSGISGAMDFAQILEDSIKLDKVGIESDSVHPDYVAHST